MALNACRVTFRLARGTRDCSISPGRPRIRTAFLAWPVFWNSRQGARVKGSVARDAGRAQDDVPRPTAQRNVRAGDRKKAPSEAIDVGLLRIIVDERVAMLLVLHFGAER